MRRTPPLVAFVLGLGLAALAIAPARADEVTDFQNRIQTIRANYSTTLGLFDRMRADVEAISVLPNGKAIVGVTGQQFEGALKACWEAPLKELKGVQRQAIDVGRAASTFQSRSMMKELDDTKIELSNALGSVDNCGPDAMAAAKVEADKLSGEAKAALDDKLALINSIRVVSKKTLPEKTEALGKEAEKLKTDLVTSVKKAEAKAVVAAKNPLGGGGKKEKAHVDKLKMLEGDIDAIASLVANDVPTVGTELGDTATKVGKNITDVSQLVGK